MFTLFSPFSGLSMDLLTSNQPQPQPLPSSSLNNKRKERNKIKRQKYKLKKKLQKNKKKQKKQKKNPIPFKAKCNKAWKWKTLKSRFLQTKQKRLLFKVHNYISLKEQNLALIYKLQCNISSQRYKDRNSVIHTSTKSSSSIHSSSNIQNYINLLKDQNTSLQKRITNIKLSQRTSHPNRISFLKSYHKGHKLKIQLTKANATYRQFSNLFNSRINLFYTNVANFMNLELQLQRNELINKEKDKLSSTNKIHNFTTTSLPPETISLLNKGTNFIPTTSTSTSSTSSLTRTILSEVNTTLCSIIHKRTIKSSHLHLEEIHTALSLIQHILVHSLY